MSKWGTFGDYPTSEVHVAPCDDKGIMLPPHVPTHECPCSPFWDGHCWVHNDPERGGANA